MRVPNGQRRDLDWQSVFWLSLSPELAFHDTHIGPSNDNDSTVVQFFQGEFSLLSSFPLPRTDGFPPHFRLSILVERRDRSVAGGEFSGMREARLPVERWAPYASIPWPPASLHAERAGVGLDNSCVASSIHTYLNNMCQECDELRNPSLHVLECPLASRVPRHIGIELLILYVLPYILLTASHPICKIAKGPMGRRSLE
jgi:hypothetical protein